MVREGAPDVGGSGAEGSVSHGAESCAGLMEEVGTLGWEVTGG